MKKIKSYLAVAISLLTLWACNDFGDLNKNPNGAETVSASTLLTNAQYNFYNLLNGVGVNAGFGMLMVQHWTQNEYTSRSRYDLDVTHFNTTFRVLYTDVAKELQRAKELVSDPDATTEENQKHILDIMSAQVFAVLTDGFGDIPYTEALQSNYFPAYDTQANVYSNLLATLDTAANSLDTSSSSFGAKDGVYQGNVDKWKKFANSLLLRYAVRIIDADPTMAQTYITKAINGGLFTSNDDNADFAYPNVDARANPLYRNHSPQVDNRDDYCVTKLLVDTLNTMNDPRLEKFAKPASGGSIVGMEYGLTDNAATELKPTTSRPNDAVREATTPFHVLTYAEVQFLLSEVYARGLATGDAQAAYEAGITASMQQWGINDSDDITDYITAHPYDAGNWKALIGMQKWIALYMNGFEAWNEWRRLDEPNLTPTSNGLINSIPVKLPYPLSETQNNSEQLGKVTTTPGDLTSKVWWDKN